jgi:hypothetical protein
VSINVIASAREDLRHVGFKLTAVQREREAVETRIAALRATADGDAAARAWELATLRLQATELAEHEDDLLVRHEEAGEELHAAFRRVERELA